MHFATRLCTILIVIHLTLSNLASSQRNRDRSSANSNQQPISFPRGYDLNSPPKSRIKVWVGHVVKDIAEVSEKDFSVTLIVETMVGWNDPRIQFNMERLFEEEDEDNSTLLENDSGTKEDRWYFMKMAQHKKMWKPVLQVKNLMSRVDLMETNSQQFKQGVFAVTQNEDFRLFYSNTARTTVSCVMDFRPFPFDRHTCSYLVSTGRSVNRTELAYFIRKGEPSWGMAHTSSVLQYTVEFCDIPDEQKMKATELFTGYRPVLGYAGFQVRLARIPTPYILNYYLPSGLFVIISWTSYVIPVKAIPGRISLIVTTFLSLVNIANSAFEYAPSNQGMNHMQGWIISCMGLVFVTVLEYFLLLFFNRYGAKMCEEKTFAQIKRYTDKADKVMLKVSPGLFLFFCLMYLFVVLRHDRHMSFE